MHDLAADDGVGHVEQAADQRRVLRGAPRRAARRGRSAARLQHEAALAADRHDHGVLDHLGLHQAEHLGAVVLAPVGPADAAARDVPAAQVDALHLGSVDEDLEERRRRRHRRHVGRAQLQAQPPAALGPVGVRAHGREHELQEAAQDAVLVEARDRVDARADRVAQLVELAVDDRRRGVAEARVEQLDDQRGRLRVVDQHVVLVRLGELAPHHLAVAAVGAQDLHVVPGHGGARDEPVQRVRLGVAAPGSRRRPRSITALSARGRAARRRAARRSRAGRRRRRRPSRRVGTSSMTVSPSASSTGSSDDSGILPPSFATDEARQRLGALLRLLRRLVLQADGERLAGAHALEQPHVQRREIGVRRGLVVVGEAARVVARRARRPRTSPCSATSRSSEVVVPRAAGRAHLQLERLGRDLRERRVLVVHREEEVRGVGLAEREVVVDRLAAEALEQQLLQPPAHVRVEAVARHRDQHGDALAGRVGRCATETTCASSACSTAMTSPRSSRPARLEQLVARERLEDRDRRLVVVRALDQILGGDDAPELAAQERRARGLLQVHERGEQPDQRAARRSTAPFASMRLRSIESMRARRCTRDGRFVFEISSRSPPSMRSRRPGDICASGWPCGVRRALLVAQDAASRARDELQRRPVGPVDDRVVARARGRRSAARAATRGTRRSRRSPPRRSGRRHRAPRRSCARRPPSSRRGRRRRRAARRASARPRRRAPRARSGVEPLDELDAHDRLARGRAARAADAHDRAVGGALDAEDRVQQRAHREALRRDRAAHGVDEERRVGRCSPRAPSSRRAPRRRAPRPDRAGRRRTR